MTTVVMIGNWKHPFCTEVYLARAFRENGCTVAQVQQEEAVDRGTAHVAEVVRATKADLVTYTRTHSRQTPGTEFTDLWRRLADQNVVTASIHLDRFWDLEREHLIGDGDPLFTTAHVFTADGGNTQRWFEAGVNHHWMMPAVDRQEAVEAAEIPAAHDGPDIVFTGSVGRYHDAYPHRAALVDHLRRTYGGRFVRYGPDRDARDVVRMADLSWVYRQAKIVVGDSCFANSSDRKLSRNYWSDRVPETIGRGGFLLHPWVDGLRGFGGQAFGPDELATYNPGDWDDLDTMIGGFLANPGEREGYVERGRARVLRDHTYTVRVGEILRTVGLTTGDRHAEASPA